MPPIAHEVVLPAGTTAPAAEKEHEPSRNVTAVRYGFIDLLRGFALLMMIETHVVNAYLPVMARKGSDFFFWLAFTNGLVAPGFLFAAGFSLVLQSDRHWDSWLRFRLPFWKQMGRLGFICLVAYYCHLQGFKLSRYLTNWGDPVMWKRTFQVDVLQCIVASLLVVHLIILLIRKKHLLPWGAGLLAGLVAIATPWIWATDFRSSLPLALALFLNPHGISLFPVFPWICFVLAGTCASCVFLKSVGSNQVKRYMNRISLLGALMIAGGLLLRNFPIQLPGHVNFYTTSPLYVMIRIGSILVICALLYALETKLQWAPRLIRLAGRESLLVYGAHLWVIYALLRGKRLGPLMGLQFGYLGCFVLSLAIIVAMLFLASHWHELKKNHPSGVKYAQAAAVIIMFSLFVLS